MFTPTGSFVFVFSRYLAGKTILLVSVLSEIEVHGVPCKPTRGRHLAVMQRTAGRNMKTNEKLPHGYILIHSTQCCCSNVKQNVVETDSGFFFFFTSLVYNEMHKSVPIYFVFALKKIVSKDLEKNTVARISSLLSGSVCFKLFISVFWNTFFFFFLFRLVIWAEWEWLTLHQMMDPPRELSLTWSVLWTGRMVSPRCQEVILR